ncbi:MAG: methylated-DNA--[protein]-cysteine S-methyltransferase [Bacteroidota bacterium]
MNSKSFHSPLGRLTLTEINGEIVRLSFDESLDFSDQSSIISKAEEQLNDYFLGRRKRFDLPLNPEGTAFQKNVWEELEKIPFGATSSYGELARKLGDPKKMRAIGAANGQNPIPIIIPCHRVVGKDGKMIGFSGGVERKIKLLEHEGALLAFG